MPRSIPARRLTILPLLATLAACGAPLAPPVAQLQPVVASAVVAPPTPVPTSPPSPTIQPTLTPSVVPTATTVSTATPAPSPTPADVSAVSGEQSFARGAVTKRPWMVMIDNHPNAYPQSGLNKASMVFEGLAEYGVTRFIALFQGGATEDAREIGPIRSTRLYFAQWAMSYRPLYVHAGGSPDGIALVETTDQLINFEALRQPKYTWRDTRRTAPQNLYTSSALLRSFAADKNVPALVDPAAGYLFDRIAPAASPQATTIDYFFLDRSSRAGFRYDSATNGYYRVMRDQPHMDRITGQQLWTRNVVVMQVDEAPRVGDEKRRIDQNVVGDGPARVFLSGQVINATWRKGSAEAPLRFYDGNDKEIVFNVGPIWVAAIPTLDRLTIK